MSYNLELLNLYISKIKIRLFVFVEFKYYRMNYNITQIETTFV